MAKGGSGDILTGLITGLVGCGYKSIEAAMIGVYLHGLAGDEAARQWTEEGMQAGDTISALPYAWQVVSERPNTSRP